MADDTDTRPRRSVSQINQFLRCPMAWKLARVDNVWQRPAAWLPQGSAVHSVAENYELRKLAQNPMSLKEALELFNAEYAREVEKYTEITPNLEYWSRSGPYGGEADIERRWAIGREQVERFIRWAEGPSRVVWLDPEDGTPGVELGFEFDLDGILVRGYIDAVHSEGKYVKVVDLKTGNHPGDDFQLGVYKVALEEVYGLACNTGTYWMGKSGKETFPFDLTDWTREAVSARFHEVEAKIEGGEFTPDPEPSKCRFCDVSLSCEFSLA